MGVMYCIFPEDLFEWAAAMMVVYSLLCICIVTNVGFFWVGFSFFPLSLFFFFFGGCGGSRLVLNCCCTKEWMVGFYGFCNICAFQKVFFATKYVLCGQSQLTEELEPLKTPAFKRGLFCPSMAYLDNILSLRGTIIGRQPACRLLSAVLPREVRFE